MTQINAYLRFNGNCREAMLFYRDCFGGELDIQTVAGSLVESSLPLSAADQVLHASLATEYLMLMASEMVGEEGFEQGNNISLCLNCSREDEARRYFARLSVGGRVHFELSDAFWGGLYGSLTDKFGIRWLVNAERNDNN